MRRDYTIRRAHHSLPVFPAIVVAIPAQNEESQIAACLEALVDQRTLAGAPLPEPVGIVCLVNGTQDATFDIVQAHASRNVNPIRVYDVTMAPETRHAGGARRAAMELAASWIEEGSRQDGVIFTTDADSIPAPDWIASACAALRRGVDGVAGPIALHAKDALALPPHVRARGALEDRYEALLTELFARLDPRPHDLWPRHATEAGANLAVTLRAYRAIGGLPKVACGEDRALVAVLEQQGFKVRHDSAPRVSTSGRLTGRAAGGVADTIRLRCEVPEALCDGYLEPALNARFRGRWRGRLRRAFAEGKAHAMFETFTNPAIDQGRHREEHAKHDDAAIQRQTGLLRSARNGGDVGVQSSESFGVLWDRLEQADPRLARKLLKPSELPHEIEAVTAMLRRLRARDALRVQTDRDDSPASVPAE